MGLSRKKYWKYPCKPRGKEKIVGKSPAGRVYEQPAAVTDENGRQRESGRQERYDCPLRALRAFVVLFFKCMLHDGEGGRKLNHSPLLSITKAALAANVSPRAFRQHPRRTEEAGPEAEKRQEYSSCIYLENHIGEKEKVALPGKGWCHANSPL